MTIADIIRRSLRSLRAARARTLLTALAIATGSFALTLTLAASSGAKQYAAQIVSDNFNPQELIVTADPDVLSGSDSGKPQEYDPRFGSVIGAAGASRQVKMLSTNDLQALREVPGIAAVRPSIALNLQYITRDGQKRYVATATAYSAYKPPALLAGHIPQQLANGNIILPAGFVRALGFQSAQQAIGRTVRLAVGSQPDQTTVLQALTNSDDLQTNQPAVTEQTFRVIAVTKKPSTLVQPGTDLYLKLSEADVMHLNDVATKGTSNYHKYFSAYADVQDGTNTSKLDAAQARIKQLGYGAQSVVDTEQTITQIITVLQGIVSVFGLIAVVASVFGVVNTMYISVIQRTREIGLMKAFGARRHDINRLFLFEAGLLGLLGGVLGSLAAVVLGTALNPFIASKLGLGSQHLLQFSIVQILLLIIILVLVAVTAGLLPARKAARLDPIEALRTE